ncbi:MAG TPA: substrate-binding domain-containing protein, partial [Rhodothermales bacterium]|nr:substrate-binding domain-containing protein [Rhodothermales bacterium]
IRENRLPDALFAASDLQALGALSALQDAGLSAPDDVALVGFDDVRVAAFARLSTIRQPMYEMGHAAAERLLERLETPDLMPVAREFKPELVVRGSSVRQASPVT